MTKLSYFDARRLARAIVREQRRSNTHEQAARPKTNFTLEWERKRPVSPVSPDLPYHLTRDEDDALARRPWIKEALLDAKAAASRMGADWEIVVSNRRTAAVVDARYALIEMVSRRHPHLSLPDIGAIFHRDHTSILHCLRKQGAILARQQQAAEEAA